MLVHRSSAVAARRHGVLLRQDAAAVRRAAQARLKSEFFVVYISCVSGPAYILAKAHIFRHYDYEHALLCKHPITYYVSPTTSFRVTNKL